MLHTKLFVHGRWIWFNFGIMAITNFLFFNELLLIIVFFIQYLREKLVTFLNLWKKNDLNLNQPQILPRIFTYLTRFPYCFGVFSEQISLPMFAVHWIRFLPNHISIDFDFQWCIGDDAKVAWAAVTILVYPFLPRWHD